MYGGIIRKDRKPLPMKELAAYVQKTGSVI
jgi:hypothetical protein